MNANDAFTLGCIIFGALLIAKTLGGSFIARLPLSAAMLYLAEARRLARWAGACLSSMCLKIPCC